MDIIDDYFKHQKEVYDYFGFKEDWVVYPLKDYRKHYWFIVNNEEIHFGEKVDVINQYGNYYVHDIYKQRFYEKFVYTGKEYTMIFVDTNTDRNKFFAIYDNSKKINR